MSLDLSNSPVLAQRPRLKEACVRLHDMAQELGPDAKLPTMLELSDQFGMSLKTLNRAVRELESRHILHTINGVGIYVASKKRHAQTGNLGFLTNTIRHLQNITYWGLIMTGMRAEAEQRDRHMLFIDNIERFHQWEKIDGALLTDVHESSYDSPKIPHPPKGLPCVALLNPLPNTIGVTADDFRSLYDLTRHLIELGHQRIAYVAAFNEGVLLLQNRLAGYRQALQDAGIAPDERLARELYMDDLHLHGETFEEIGEHHIERWLATSWKSDGCTAVIAQNDATAQGMIKALQAAGCRVPQDVSVAGFDGIFHSPLPPLTTMEIPLFDMGQTAVKMLSEWIENPTQTPSDIALPGRLVVGDTSAPPPTKTQKKNRSKIKKTNI